ncbi:MAG TPA: polysaccharide biosynthesis C-terminal domain-containing protein [Vicingus sp.]|nr:polysaccharide biosynthesis C-terminal domain-containing protein [Vicingus sp.]
MLVKNIINSVLTQIPVFVLGIVSGVFSTRILGEEAKGVFSLFQANYLLFVMLFSFGIQTGIVYFVSSKKYSEQIVAGLSFAVFIVSSFLLTSILLIAYYFGFSAYFFPEGYDKLPYVFSVVILFILTLFNNVTTSFFQAHSMFSIINRISLINSIVNAMLFSIVYFFILNNGFSSSERFDYMLIMTIFLVFMNSLVWIVLYVYKIGVKPKVNNITRDIIKKFIGYSLLIYLGTVINFFNYRLDLWIVNYFLDEKELSHYSLAANIAQIILIVAVTIASVILPKLSNETDEKKFEIFTLVSRASFSVFFILIVMAIITSNFLIPLLYGKEFLPTIVPFQILAIGIFISCITQVFTIIVITLNKSKYSIYACTIGLFFTVFFDLYLIPIYNINGAAIATLISYFVIFIVTYYLIVAKTEITTKNLFLLTKSDLTKGLSYIKRKK